MNTPTPSLTTILASPTIKYMTILPGQTQVIKKSAKILAVLNNGNVVATTTCAPLPTATPLLCYAFTWVLNDDLSNGSIAWEDVNGKGHTTIVKIHIGGIDYPVNISARTIQLKAWFDSKSIPIILNTVPTLGVGALTGAHQEILTFQTIDIIATDMYIEFSTQAAGNVRMYPTAYNCPSSNS